MTDEQEQNPAWHPADVEWCDNVYDMPLSEGCTIRYAGREGRRIGMLQLKQGILAKATISIYSDSEFPEIVGNPCELMEHYESIICFDKLPPREYKNLNSLLDLLVKETFAEPEPAVAQ